MSLVPRAEPGRCGLSNPGIGMRRSDYRPPPDANVPKRTRAIGLRGCRALERLDPQDEASNGGAPDPSRYPSHVAQP